jgi:hypothetical protein
MMRRRLLLLAALPVLLHATLEADLNIRPTRTTTEGLVMGYWHGENQSLVQVFEGVPYAAPPVGQLRFEVHLLLHLIALHI